MGLLPTSALIANAVVLNSGVVENTKVEPPLEVLNVSPLLLVDETVKSEATAVVAPDDPETRTVQPIAFPTRSGDG